jgi:putative ABC transport system permease protein
MIQHAIRSLMKSPGFALASIAALALGIGANTAIFSLVNAVLLRPLPYKDPSELVMLWQQPPTGGMNDMSAADFQDWRDRNHSFAQMAAITGAAFNLTTGDRPEKVSGLQVSSSFFSALGVMPALGRTFLPKEETSGADHVVMLSDGLWTRRFGRDIGVVGRQISIDRQNYTVVGVMPPGFQFDGPDYALWTPLVLDPNRANRNFYFLQAVARLKPGVTVEQARTDLDTISRQLALEYPKSNQNWGAGITLLRDHVIGNARTAILILLGAVAFVLLIACSNVANLLLVRAAGRQKEFAIRTALGAPRADIVRRMLTESMLLAAVGAALGILLAHWIIAALIAQHPGYIPRLNEVAIDARVLAFTVFISLLTALLFGLIPASQSANIDLNDVLKEGGRGSSGCREMRTRGVLVVSEIALAGLLLIGAGLLIRSFAALASSSTGYPTANLLTTNTTVQEDQYASEQQMAADFERAVQRIRTIPGVLASASATNIPVGGWNQGRVFTIEGRAPKSASEILAAGYLSVTPEYFHAVGLQLRKGREFSAQDRSGAPNVVIISESMAKRYWPGEDPIGKRILSASRQFRGHGLGVPVPREIVGIAADVQHLQESAEVGSEMYVPQSQNTLPFTYFVVRTSGDSMRLAQPITRAVNEILKDSPVAAVRTIEDRLAESFSRPRFQMFVLGIFAAGALLLAAMGIYGVIAYSVTQRTQEIGIRMALGASSNQVLALVLSNALKLALLGIAFGLTAAFACTRLMTTMLYNVGPTDFATFAAVSALLISTSVAASLIPAWRASRTDPARTLRSQL